MAANYNVGNAILGSFEAVQRGAQNRFDNQYKNRVLDLDNRDLEERQRQFDLAKRDADADRKLEQQKLTEDVRQFNATNLTNNRVAANNEEITRQTGVELESKQATEYATNTARRYFSGGLLNEDATNLGDGFFERDQDGRLKNRNEAIDLLNLNSEALISDFGNGQFKDMEVAGFEYDKDKGTTKVLLRGRGTDEDLVPATAGASDSPEDVVIELTEDQFRNYTRRQWSVEIAPEIDSTKVDLSAVQRGKLVSFARLAKVEQDIQRAVTAKVAQAGQPALLRQVTQDLADTEGDPQARAALLDSLGIDPAQFDTPTETVDPTQQYLGPDSPIRDPLSDQPVAASLSAMAGGPTMLFKNKGEQQTEFPNLVAELQQNFEESENMQSGEGLKGRPMTGEERSKRQTELDARRVELVENIPNEIAKRKVAREAYAQQLNKQRVSQPQVDNALAQYDAYIAQLESYIPVQEKAVVDIAAEIGKLSEMSPQQLEQAIASGSVPITEEQIGNIRKHLTDKQVRSAVDLAREPITTQIAAFTSIAVTAQDPGTRLSAMDSLTNILDTGSATLTENQLLEARDRQEGRAIERLAREDERTDKLADRNQTARDETNENVKPVRQALQAVFVPTQRPDMTGMTEKQMEAAQTLYDGRTTLRQKAAALWNGGAGQDALAGMQNTAASKMERQEFGKVFNGAATASIAALIARKPDSELDWDWQKVGEFVFGEDILDTFRDVGLADDELSASEIRTSDTSFQNLEVETDRNGVPIMYRIKNPDGGVYRGGVTPRDLVRELGNDAYSVLQDQLAAANKIDRRG